MGTHYVNCPDAFGRRGRREDKCRPDRREDMPANTTVCTVCKVYMFSCTKCSTDADSKGRGKQAKKSERFCLESQQLSSEEKDEI